MKMLLIFCSTLLVFATSAHAAPVTYTNVPPGESAARFHLEASDGLSTIQEVQYESLTAGEIVAETEVTGILTPYVTLNTIDITMTDHVIEGSFSPGFDYALTIDQLTVSLFDAGGYPLATTSSNAHIVWNRALASISGSLAVPGGVLPFSTSIGLQDFALGGTLMIVNADGSINFQGSSSPSWVETFDSPINLGSIGGVDYRLRTAYFFLDDELLRPVPEPSVALLMGLGLFGLAARRR